MKRLFPALGLFLLFNTPVFALSVPEKPQSYVNDYAGLLSGGAKQQLENKLYAFAKATSNQLLIAIFPSLDGEVLEDFSIRLADKWKIGTKKHNNGVILLIFKEDRKMRIEVGYGLEGALPDATAMMIIQREMVPSFREGDFDGGVSKAVDAIIQATKGEYKAPLSGMKDPAQKYGQWAFLVMFLYFLLPLACYAIIAVLCFGLMGVPGVFAALVLIAILEFFRRFFLSARFLGSTITSGRTGYWGGGGLGGGGFSGGFGGGGGGSFGGGGASGGW